MVLTRKGISASSEAIIKEQRQITREKLLASPGLIIGTIGFLLILVTAILVPILNMGVVDNASNENNENTRRKATVVPTKIEYV